MNYTKEDFERETFGYLKEVQGKLVEMLQELNNKPNSSQAQIYITFQADHIRKVTAGYISIRSQGMKYASSSLVRTCLESMYLMGAVKKDSVNLFHVACFERKRDLKLIRKASERSGEDGIEHANSEWEKSKSVFADIFVGTPLVEKEMSLYQFAEEAGFQAEYNLMYRMYSNVVHASWRAALGKFNFLHQFDNFSMSLCVARACQSINGLCGLPREDLTAMTDRLNQLQALSPPP